MRTVSCPAVQEALPLLQPPARTVRNVLWQSIPFARALRKLAISGRRATSEVRVLRNIIMSNEPLPYSMWLQHSAFFWLSPRVAKSKLVAHACGLL